MKLCLTIAVVVSLMVAACSKRATQQDCDAYWITEMKKKWAPLSSCSPEYYPYLAKAMYLNSEIYYTHISCHYCQITPPQYGVNCAGDSIKINWDDVKDARIIASCQGL